MLMAKKRNIVLDLYQLCWTVMKFAQQKDGNEKFSELNKHFGGGCHKSLMEVCWNEKYVMWTEQKCRSSEINQSIRCTL